MHIIKQDAVDSTNAFLKRLARERSISDYTVVTTHYQTKGKGQAGNHWVSNPGENLLFSVYKRVHELAAVHQFYINMGVSLAVYQALKRFSVPELYIKWPNDILSANRKICGMLLENTVQNGFIQASVIGIGLNVNQCDFPGLPHASSLRRILGAPLDLEVVLKVILEELQAYMEYFRTNDFTLLKKLYENQLLGKDKEVFFKDVNQKFFKGAVKGVTPSGRLEILDEKGVIRTFGLKEISWLYEE